MSGALPACSIVTTTEKHVGVAAGRYVRELQMDTLAGRQLAQHPVSCVACRFRNGLWEEEDSHTSSAGNELQQHQHDFVVASLLLLLGQYSCRWFLAHACFATPPAPPCLSPANKPLTVYSALSSSSTRRSIRAAALYLGIQQHLQAPELTNPARMPDCLGSSKVSKALAAALNTKYAGQLQMNASVDTTYIQVTCLGCRDTTSNSRSLEHSAVHRRC